MAGRHGPSARPRGDRWGRGGETDRVIRYLPAVLAFALAVFALVDVIGTREPRNLPKWAWIVMILLFPLVGSVVYLLAGRPKPVPPATSPYAEYERPGRTSSSDPAKDAEFLRQVRARAEEQRARARYEAEEKRRREQGEQPG